VICVAEIRQGSKKSTKNKYYITRVTGQGSEQRQQQESEQSKPTG